MKADSIYSIMLLQGEQDGDNEVRFRDRTNQKTTILFERSHWEMLGRPGVVKVTVEPKP